MLRSTCKVCINLMQNIRNLPQSVYIHLSLGNLTVGIYYTQVQQSKCQAIFFYDHLFSC